MPRTQRRYLASCTETLKCQHQNASWNHGNDGNNPSGEFGVRQKDDQDKVWRIPMFNNGVKTVRQGTWGQSSRVEERKRRWHGNPRHGGGSQGRGMSKRSKKIMTKNDQINYHGAFRGVVGPRQSRTAWGHSALSTLKRRMVGRAWETGPPLERDVSQVKTC